MAAQPGCRLGWRRKESTRCSMPPHLYDRGGVQHLQSTVSARTLTFLSLQLDHTSRLCLVGGVVVVVYDV